MIQQFLDFCPCFRLIFFDEFRRKSHGVDGAIQSKAQDFDLTRTQRMFEDKQAGKGRVLDKGFYLKMKIVSLTRNDTAIRIFRENPALHTLRSLQVPISAQKIDHFIQIQPEAEEFIDDVLFTAFPIDSLRWDNEVSLTPLDDDAIQDTPQGARNIDPCPAG